jgi:flagellar FliL protein
MAAKKKKGDAEDEKKGMGAKLKPVLVIVAVAAGYKFLLAPKPAATNASASGAVAAAEVKVQEGAIVAVPELVLNLAGAEQHYLRVGAALVLEKGVDPKAFTEEIPLASDVLVDVLSEKTPEDLSQPGIKTELKAELSEKVREAYEGKKVVRVVFTSFVMQ